MDTTGKINLIRYSAFLLAFISIPLIIYQFQQELIIEGFRSVGCLSGALAFALRPQAFVVLPDSPRTVLAELSMAQKALFLVAIVLLLLPFLAFYISALGEIL